ncbi:MAG: response regulator, partial [Candidatus Hydrogenedentes bacterium]|nr:response regulator [Candidatus Hydrogenedentota bacterium]
RVIGENIILDVRDDLELGTIHADTGQVEQVLMNLCVNARDAMPDGGTITIKTKNVQIDKVFSKEQDENIPPGCYICLSTSDTGCGMHEKTCKNIFDPFFTTKEVGKGTGLGLATVYGIVKQHEGFIQVQSEVDKGTTFSIYLPRVDRTAARVIVEEKKIVPSGTETILIAEDDRMVCRLSETVLKRSGYTVLTAADGKEAWELFQKHADDISLILLDVIMPKLSGLAVFERVREVHPDILVLFSSGYSIDTVHAGVVFNDRTQMIQKPYHPDALLRKVRQVLDSSEKDHK